MCHGYEAQKQPVDQHCCQPHQRPNAPATQVSVHFNAATLVEQHLEKHLIANPFILLLTLHRDQCRSPLTYTAESTLISGGAVRHFGYR